MIEAQFVDRKGNAHRARFEAIVQKTGDRLSVLGMTPFGSRAFLIEQMGNDVRFQRFIRRNVPFPPRFILVDVHRAYAREPEAEKPEGGGLRNGWHSVVENGEERRDRFERGVLVERRYRRLDGRPAGEITIRYGGGQGAMGADRVHLHNGWLGYVLEIETLQRQRL